jgi:hypothetical protein
VICSFDAAGDKFLRSDAPFCCLASWQMFGCTIYREEKMLTSDTRGSYFERELNKVKHKETYIRHFISFVISSNERFHLSRSFVRLFRKVAKSDN